MGISKYEASAIYDYNVTQLDSNYLVIDLDDCSYGFCRCSNECTTKLLDSWNSSDVNLWILCVEKIKELIRDYPFDISNELQKQLISGNDVLYNYIISNRMVDAELLHFSERTISCSEFEKCISESVGHLEGLLSRISNQINSDVLENANVIVLGRAQVIQLFIYYIKKYLSADPFLPDKRFRNSEFRDPCDKIVAIGLDIYESKSFIQQEYSLIAFDKESNTSEKLLSVKKGQRQEELRNFEYTGPIFITEDDSLTLHIDEREVIIDVPYIVAPLESDLVELGIGIKEEKVTLFIRRCRFPNQVYSVAL